MEQICLPQMPRRAFLAITAGGLLAAPLAAEGQQAGKIPRIAWLGTGSPTEYPDLREAFRQGLADLGYVDGQSIEIASRLGMRPARFP